MEYQHGTINLFDASSLHPLYNILKRRDEREPVFDWRRPELHVGIPTLHVIMLQ